MENKWIECKQKLPIENELYLTWDDYHKMIKTLVFNPYHKCWDDEWGDDHYTTEIDGKVTHWMELPNKPVI